MAKRTNSHLKTRTVDGIEVTVDTRAFEDMRFIRTFTELAQLDEEHAQMSGDGGDGPKPDEFARVSLGLIDTLDRLAAFIFGDDVDKYQDAVAERNDGFLVYQDWLGFVSHVSTAFMEKNGEARPSADGE